MIGRSMLAAVGIMAALSLPQAASADEFTVELDIISLNNALWARQPMALPFGATDSGGDIVTLQHDTQPECAASALRLVRDAMNQTAVDAAALRSVAVTVDALASFLGGLGLRGAANVAEVSIIYLTAESREDFYTDLGAWLAGEAVASGIVDNVTAEAAGEITEGLAGQLLEAFRRPILSASYEHPQCGAIDMRYRIVPALEEGAYAWDDLAFGSPMLRFYADGDCHQRWPANRGDQLGLWRIVAEMPLSDAGREDDVGTLTVGDPHYAIVALCGDQNDGIAYDEAMPPSHILSFLPTRAPSGNWYFLGERPGTWTEGRAFCRAFGADLVVIETKEENDFLGRSIAPACTNPNGCWIGATDTGTEGSFVWIDGSPVTTATWKSGEPNDHCNGEDYVHMMRSGAWNDQAIDGGCLNWGLMQPICEAPDGGSTL